MGLFLADGTRVTKGSVTTTAEADPLVTIDTDLYEGVRTGREDDEAEGTLTVLFARAGDRLVRQSAVDALFKPALVDQVTPNTGLVAGGTEVTITGNRLDGVSAVAFGATPAASFEVVSDRELVVTAPAGAAAGPVDLVFTDDAGTTTVTDGFTYE